MSDTRLVARTGVALALLSLGACGGGGGGTPTATTPTTTQPPCTQATAFQGQGALPAQTLDTEAFTTTTTGRLDVTVDWTFASSSIGVYVVSPGSCNLSAFNARSCNFLLRSESGAKPRKVSVANFAAGSYELLLANFATQQESLSLLVQLSSATCPALAGSPNGTGMAGAASFGQVIRLQQGAR